MSTRLATFVLGRTRRSCEPRGARTWRTRYPRRRRPVAADRHPAPIDEPLEAIALVPASRAHLPPDLDHPAATRHLHERQHHRDLGGLRAAVDGLEPALPAVDVGLVAVQVVDEHVDLGHGEHASRRLGDVRGLLLQGHSERIGSRLVCELGEPDARAWERRLYLAHESLDGRHGDGRAPPARAGVRSLTRIRGIRMVRVRIEKRPCAVHEPDEAQRGHASAIAARRGHTTSDEVGRIDALESAIRRIEKLLDVVAGSNGVEPASLVGLVPDHPLPHEVVALRDALHEALEVRAVAGHAIRRLAFVRPGRRAPDRDDGVEALLRSAFSSSSLRRQL